MPNEYSLKGKWIRFINKIKILELGDPIPKDKDVEFFGRIREISVMEDYPVFIVSDCQRIGKDVLRDFGDDHRVLRLARVCEVTSLYDSELNYDDVPSFVRSSIKAPYEPLRQSETSKTYNLPQTHLKSESDQYRAVDAKAGPDMSCLKDLSLKVSE